MLTMEQAFLCKFKTSYLYILLIITLAIFLVRNDLLGNKVQFTGDAKDQVLSDRLVVRNAVLNHFFPLWSPFLMSGMPLFSKIQLGVISLNTLLEFITPNIYFSNFLSILIHLIILGIGIYLLSREIKLEPKYAFISSVVCMLSSYVTASLFFRSFQFFGLSFLPYAIMFTIKGIKEKKWLKYSIYAGLFLSFQFLEGAFEVFTYSCMTVAYILFFHLIGKSFLNRLIKSVLVGIIILLVALGVSAIKLLPAIEFANMGSRQQAFDFETTLGSHIALQNTFDILIDDRSLSTPLGHSVKGGDSTGIGILSAILILGSIFNFRKKNYLLFLGMLIFGLLMITKSPLIYFLWKYFPYFNKTKHVMKAQFIFLIAGSVLAAYGVYYIVSKIKDSKKAKIVYASLAILTLITSWGFTYDIKMRSPYQELNSVEIMKYMSNYNEEMFRFKVFETNGIDWGTNYYSTYYGLHDIYGYVNLWLLDYLPVFLSVANQQPAKLFGMLNMKYMTSMQELTIPGFTLVKAFEYQLENCQYNSESILIESENTRHCPEYAQFKKAWGQYLYINERFMPRAYMVDKATLIVGEKNLAKQVAYQLMLEQNFNPSNNAIIIGKESINQYSPEELKKYSVVILTLGSIDQSSLGILKSYKDSGGMILPDILSGKNAIMQDDIERMWKVFTGNHTKIGYIETNYNHYKAKPAKGNFAVFSELFSVYPGWFAESEGKKLEILNANVMNTAVYTGSKEALIDFIYKPKSFAKGFWITIVTILLIGWYFIVV